MRIGASLPGKLGHHSTFQGPVEGFPRAGVYHASGPQSLNRSAFLLERFAYQDVRQQPALLTTAYAWCLQYWVEKHNLPRNPDFCPWAESMRELQQTVQEFVTISYQDVTQNLEVERPETSHPQPKKTIFSQVLAMPVDKQKTVETPSHSISPLTEDDAIWCTSPPPEVEWSDRYMLPLQWAN